MYVGKNIRFYFRVNAKQFLDYMIGNVLTLLGVLSLKGFFDVRDALNKILRPVSIRIIYYNSAHFQ